MTVPDVGILHDLLCVYSAWWFGYSRYVTTGEFLILFSTVFPAGFGR